MKTIIMTTLIHVGLGLTACSDSAQFSEQAVPAGQDSQSNATNPDGSIKNPDGTITLPDGSIQYPDGTVSPAANVSPSVESGSTPPIGENGPGDGGPTTAVPPDPNAITGPGGTTEEDKAKAVQKLREVCEQGTPKSLTQSIVFPERRGCSFGSNGNLAKRDAFLQAREAQVASLTLPEKAQLCGLEIGSAATTIQYDDFMILTLNDYVLLSSNSRLMEGLQDSNGAALWDFERVKGVDINFNSPHYCLGTVSSLCEVPVTDTPGKFQFQIDPSSLELVADKIIDQRVLNLALISTGDNDDKDCWHTEFTLDFTLNYVE